MYELRETQTQNKLKGILLKKNTTNEQFEVFFGNHQYKDRYIVAIYSRNKSQSPLSNYISLRTYPYDEYPPPKQSNYTPKPIDIMKVRKIFDAKQKIINVYWDTPPLTYGKIEYKIIIGSGTKQMH
eukprot:434766_1